MAPSLHQAGRWLCIFTISLILIVLIACSSDAPTVAPTTAPPTAAATATATPPTPTAEPTIAPTSPSLNPTATAAPPPPPTSTATFVPPPPTVSPFVSDEHEAASERVFDLVEELVQELGHREAGTHEELLAAEYIKERLDAMGYSAEIQSFTIEHFDVQRYLQTRGETAKVIVESPIEIQLPGLLLSSTPKGGKQNGPMVPVGQGRSEDFPADGLVWTLRISSGVSKGIDKSVVQSGRDFPYIRVGGGQ